jgi:hypothetical protein
VPVVETNQQVLPARDHLGDSRAAQVDGSQLRHPQVENSEQ